MIKLAGPGVRGGINLGSRIFKIQVGVGMRGHLPGWWVSCHIGEFFLWSSLGEAAEQCVILSCGHLQQQDMGSWCEKL